MRLRDYQTKCIECLSEAFDRYSKILCVLFTGAGKTVIFAEIARRFGGARILVIAPMRELVWQGLDVLSRYTDEHAGTEMAEHSCDVDLAWGGSRNVVASAQTLMRGRWKKFLGFDIVIVDEAHALYSPAFLKILEEYRKAGAVIVGFTATPYRMDGKPLMHFYEHVAFEYALSEGIRDGWCCFPVAKLVRCDDLDLSQVRISHGDYSAADLDMAMGCSKTLHRLCLLTKEQSLGSTIAFLPGVKSAQQYADMLSKQYGISCGFVCGDRRIQPESDRNVILSQFRKGEIQVLSNCHVATMGFDAPIARTVLLARPTKSRSLWTQIVGRVTRPEHGILDSDLCHESVVARHEAIANSNKPSFLILDVCGSSRDQNLITAVDAFARAGTPADVIRRARQLAEDEGGDPDDMLAQAAEDLRKAKLLEEALKNQSGVANGLVVSTDLTLKGVRCISEYKCPVRGPYSGKTMGEVDDGYIRWAITQQWLQPWQRRFFTRERDRRAAIAIGHRRRAERVVSN